MPARMADAQWNGDLLNGNGTMKLGTGAFEGPYSYQSRFESGTGTNPEELIAAAHAGCFSMALSGILTAAGHAPNYIHTDAKVRIEKVGEGFEITRIDLKTEGDVPGIDEETFRQKAQQAKEGCPVSKALAAVKEINMEAKLLQRTGV